VSARGEKRIVGCPVGNWSVRRKSGGWFDGISATEKKESAKMVWGGGGERWVEKKNGIKPWCRESVQDRPFGLAPKEKKKHLKSEKKKKERRG